MNRLHLAPWKAVEIASELGGTITASRATLADIDTSAKRLRVGIQDLNAAGVSDQKWGPVECEVREWNCETTVQRRYGFAGHALVDGLRLQWIDMEVPTERYGARADLIGTTEADAKLRCFAELKYAEEGSLGNGSPVSALLQALRYAVNATCDKNDRMLQVPGHARDGDIPLFVAGWYPCLLVAGNRTYWRNWRTKLGDDFSNLATFGDKVAEILADAHPESPAPWVKWAMFEDLGPAPTRTGDTFLVEPARGAELEWTSPFDPD